MIEVVICLVFIVSAASDLFLYFKTPADFRLVFPWYLRALPFSGFWLRFLYKHVEASNDALA